MKSLQKNLRIFFLTLILALVVPTVLPVHGYTATVQAAAKLSKRSVTLKKGQSRKLKITGVKKNIKWSSDQKAIVSVNKKGKITAKKVGTATITAKFGKKRLTCKVIVKNPSKPSGNGSTGNGNGQDHHTTSSGIVWIPKTGSKYHRTPSCSGMRSPAKVTLADAVNMGYEPCKRCY